MKKRENLDLKNKKKIFSIETLTIKLLTYVIHSSTIVKVWNPLLFINMKNKETKLQDKSNLEKNGKNK